MVTKQTATNDLYEIPLSQAIEWTTRWRQFQADTKPNPDDSKKAFRVDVAELQEVVNNIPGEIQYVRFYLGLDEHLIEHMILVGVDDNNQDVCTFEGKTYTYDFTRPCPTTCDVASPLFEAP